MLTTALKLLDHEEIDMIAEKLGLERAALVRDIVSSAAGKPVMIGYDDRAPVAWVLAAAELATGIFAEVEAIESNSAAQQAIEADYDLAPALMLNYKDIALGLTYDVYMTLAAFVPERSVSDVNFPRSSAPA